MIKDLNATFGMSEMEVAAKRIINNCEAKGSWLHAATFELFQGSSEQNGFLHLIEYGYLTSGYFKGKFYITDKFIKIIERKVSPYDLALKFEAPTTWEIIDSQLPHLKPKDF